MNNKDIIQHVFSQLNDRNTLVKSRFVCKQWSQIALRFIHTLHKIPHNNELLKPFKFLTTLDLNGNSKITNEGLAHVPNLITLDLSDNSTITNEGLQYVPNLITLVLSNNSTITNEGLHYVQNLTTLILSNNSTITN